MTERKIIYNSSWTILHLIENIDSENASNTIKQMLSTDYGLSNIILAAVIEGKIGNRELTRLYSINRETIQKYISLDDAYNRIVSFTKYPDFLALADEIKIKLVAFLLLIENDNPNDTAVRGVLDGRFEVTHDEVISRLNIITGNK